MIQKHPAIITPKYSHWIVKEDEPEKKESPKKEALNEGQ